MRSDFLNFDGAKVGWRGGVKIYLGYILKNSSQFPNQRCHHARPAGLMARANAPCRVAVEIFVEQNEVLEMPALNVNPLVAVLARLAR